MKKLLLFILCQIVLINLSAQNKKAYQIFSGEGKEVNYKKLFKASQDVHVILFGEIHNNPIAHWLQYELSYDLLQQGEVTFGAEMMEADNQDELNLYLTDSIDQNELDSLARLWRNYKTDYAPLIELAKEYNQKFIATNIPRRYASIVYEKGFEALDTLSHEERKWIAPLPIEYNSELPGYKKMLSMGRGHGGENLPKSQAIKDATMAYFISKNYTTDQIFIHFNGTYHSNNYEGINWYLKKLKPELKILTIATVSQAQLNNLDMINRNIADFIICVDENMTTTY